MQLKIKIKFYKLFANAKSWTQVDQEGEEWVNHGATLACGMEAQAHQFKPHFNSLHLLQLPPLSLTSPTLSLPHFHSSQLNPLLPPRTHNSQRLPRDGWCLYKGQFHHLKPIAKLRFLSLSHYSLAFSPMTLKCWTRGRRFRLKGSVSGKLFCIFVDFSSLWHFIEQVAYTTFYL